MSTPRLRPCIDFTGLVARPNEYDDQTWERLVGVPAGTCARYREIAKTYPKYAGPAHVPGQPTDWDAINAHDAVVEAWEAALPSDVRKLRDWDGWPINEMGAITYIEQISGEHPGRGGHTDDPVHVAYLLARLNVRLPQEVYFTNLRGVSWG